MGGFKGFPCSEAGALAGELHKFAAVGGRSLRVSPLGGKVGVNVRQALKINDALLTPTPCCGS